MTAPAIEALVRVTRVRFQDPRSHAAVLVTDELDSDGKRCKRQVLRIPGHLAIQRFYPAQTLKVVGQQRTWVNPRTGEQELQLAVIEWEEVRPRGAAWIDMVAGNPAFQGIGKQLATKIWSKLGSATLEALESEKPDALLEAVPELGASRASMMVEAWRGCGNDKLLRWLDQHHVPRKAAARLLQAYANQASVIELIDRDPYRLMAFGISYKGADKLATSSFGVGPSDPRRLHAAVVCCLHQAYRHGHTALRRAELIERLSKQLNFSAELGEQALAGLYQDGGFVRPFPDLYQLRGVYLMEVEIASDLCRRLDQGRQRRLDMPVENDPRSELRLTPAQQTAVAMAANENFSLILGGAGTGKTACLKELHRLVAADVGRPDAIIQMAVAGKAAKQMKEATGRDAVTVAGFLHVLEDERIANATHTVIDEASMLDVPSFYAILKRLKGRTKLVLVGDPFQLPPIGAGKVLHVLAGRADINSTTLGTVFRQGEGSSIRGAAASIRKGQTLTLGSYAGQSEGIFLLNPEKSVGDAVISAVRQLHEVGDVSNFSVLTATRQGRETSALEMNSRIQALLNGNGAGGKEGIADTGFAVGDRLVCDVNFWDLDLMNGSLGVITKAIGAEAIHDAALGRPLAEVNVDGLTKTLHELHLRHCSWGYALTCHRAQGSDFEVVIVPLDGLVDRSWLYTAVTRARRLVVLVGAQSDLQRIIDTEPRVDARVIALPRHLEEQAQGRMLDAA